MNDDSLRRIADALERIVELMEQREELDWTPEESSASARSKVASWLTEDKVPILAEELAAFVTAEQPDADSTWLDYTIVEAFWESKGLHERYDLSAKDQLLLDKVQKLVSKQREDRENAELKAEEEEIPRMADDCASWAADREVKRLTQADVEGILKKSMPKVRSTTVRSVWQQVNLLLKGSRK